MTFVVAREIFGVFFRCTDENEKYRGICEMPTDDEVDTTKLPEIDGVLAFVCFMNNTDTDSVPEECDHLDKPEFDKTTITSSNGRCTVVTKEPRNFDDSMQVCNENGGYLRHVNQQNDVTELKSVHSMIQVHSWSIKFILTALTRRSIDCGSADVRRKVTNGHRM